MGKYRGMNFTIRGLSKETYEYWKLRAERNGRSLNDEIKDFLTEYVRNFKLNKET